ncbi:hypothetical protein FGO68_gene14446 [Halteria grandinella]|uniref:Uncharacterized protein n=1 Tax=Halteria grandinella TaxID=5974 RepID=A0A8J8SZ01_HALGN|nr:hypothetical protein FGO68_gene14446 [Halteria grandinella]
MTSSATNRPCPASSRTSTSTKRATRHSSRPSSSGSALCEEVLSNSLLAYSSIAMRPQTLRNSVYSGRTQCDLWCCPYLTIIRTARTYSEISRHQL